VFFDNPLPELRTACSGLLGWLSLLVVQKSRQRTAARLA
jgi:hypothetical protein